MSSVPSCCTPVDVAEDAAQLIGVKVLVAGLEAKTGEHADMAT
jgi:hypothetical protein